MHAHTDALACVCKGFNDYSGIKNYILFGFIFNSYTTL